MHPSRGYGDGMKALANLISEIHERFADAKGNLAERSVIVAALAKADDALQHEYVGYSISLESESKKDPRIAAFHDVSDCLGSALEPTRESISHEHHVAPEAREQYRAEITRLTVAEITRLTVIVEKAIGEVLG